VEFQRQQEVARRRAQSKRRVVQQQMRVQTPEAVEGRQHVDVQTELYLEELTDHVEEADVECQTDAFLDRPPTPLFIPAKTGVDSETQILDGEVGKTLFNIVIIASDVVFQANVLVLKHLVEKIKVLGLELVFLFICH